MINWSLQQCILMHRVRLRISSHIRTINMFGSKLHEELQEYELVLASTSPRRIEILETILKLTNVKIVPSFFEENISKHGLHYIEYVQQTSLGKARAVERQLETSSSHNSLIISADTIVVCNGTIYEKPGTKERQRQMFEEYRKYPMLEVVTAVNVVNCASGTLHSHTETTKLYFDIECPSHLIDAYVECGEGLQVAGGFQYQSIGNLLFLKMEGDYFNIVGLPAKGCFTLLEKSI